MNGPSSDQLARSYVRMKLAALDEDNLMSLIPEPALSAIPPKEKKFRKRPRRVFPFKPHKQSNFQLPIFEQKSK